VGIFFLLGLGISIKKLISSLKTKKEQESITHSLLLSWLFIMLLPGILTYEGIPHALRVIGCIIPAYLLAGLGAWQSYLFVKEKTAKKTLLKLAGCLLLTAIAFAQFDKYFIKWAQSSEVDDSFTKNYTQIGLYLNSLPEETVKYVVVNELGSPLYGISIPGQTPMFIERTAFNEPKANYIKVEDLDAIEPNDKQIIIIPLYDKGIQLKLENKFPRINILEQKYFKAYIIY
jgi:hypothetical protein